MSAPNELHQAISAAAEAIIEKTKLAGGKSVGVAIIVTYQGKEKQETLSHTEGPLVPLLGSIDLTRWSLCKDATDGPDADFRQTSGG